MNKCPKKCFTLFFPVNWSRMDCAKYIERSTTLKQGVNFGYISTAGRCYYIEVRL